MQPNDLRKWLPRVVRWLLGGCLAPGLLVAADHPQWGRDFSRNMVSDERNLPDSIDPATGKNLKWKAPLGSETHSTPVVARGKVLIGTNNEEPRDPRRQGDRSVLMCLDEKDGHLLWQLVVPKLTNSIYWDWPKAGICSPATVEGHRAYLVSNRGEVLCLDLNGLANGNDGPFVDEARHAVPVGDTPIALTNTDADIIWAFDIIKECGIRQHDQAYGSVLIDGPFLYVNTSNGVDDSHKEIHAPDAPSLIVLEKSTGRLVARDNERIGPRIFHCTWSPPTLGAVDGHPRIFFAGGDGVVYGFEPLRTAPPPGEVALLKRVWRFDCDRLPRRRTSINTSATGVRAPATLRALPFSLADGCTSRWGATFGGEKTRPGFSVSTLRVPATRPAKPWLGPCRWRSTPFPRRPSPVTWYSSPTAGAEFIALTPGPARCAGCTRPAAISGPQRWWRTASSTSEPAEGSF